VPQIYEDQRLKNFVSPEFWDKGIAALNLGWMANTWTSHTSGNNGSDNSSAYLGLTPVSPGTAGCSSMSVT
jgi:outer membrane usher protein